MMSHETKTHVNLLDVERLSIGKMVVSCWEVGCSNRAKKGCKKSFYRIPKVIVNQGE